MQASEAALRENAKPSCKGEGVLIGLRDSGLRKSGLVSGGGLDDLIKSMAVEDSPGCAHTRITTLFGSTGPVATFCRSAHLSASGTPADA